MWQERAQEMPRAGGGDTRARFPLSDPPLPPPRALEVTPQPQGDSHQGPRALRAQGSPCLEPQGSERERERMLRASPGLPVCFRNWCSYVVTRTVSCHVQNGTYLQRVLQNCPWPMSCPGNR